jgi:hypothetical protein
MLSIHEFSCYQLEINKRKFIIYYSEILAFFNLSANLFIGVLHVIKCCAPPLLARVYVCQRLLGRARSYVLAPRPPPPPNISSTGDTYEDRNRDNLLTEVGGKRVGEELNHSTANKAWSSINHSLYPLMYSMCIRDISPLRVGVSGRGILEFSTKR